MNQSVGGESDFNKVYKHYVNLENSIRRKEGPQNLNENWYDYVVRLRGKINGRVLSPITYIGKKFLSEI